MSEKEKILGRIREALKISAPRPGEHRGPGHEPKPAASTRPDFRKWLPVVGETFDERLATFAMQSTELRTEFYLLATREAMLDYLREMAKTLGWKKIASHRGVLTDAACEALKMPALVTDATYAAKDLEQCEAGITECDALIAQTGSVIITTRSAGGRGLSVLPPHHVVLARREQLLADLPAAFAHLREKYAGNFPSFMSVVTGPSRTGDIERILVLGAHGPKKLTVLCY
jgi:L-lactate dehydrogenase complex protein LldG